MGVKNLRLHETHWWPSEVVGICHRVKKIPLLQTHCSETILTYHRAVIFLSQQIKPYGPSNLLQMIISPWHNLKPGKQVAEQVQATTNLKLRSSTNSSFKIHCKLLIRFS